jgi:polyisoprenoid-binding protein YceI
MILRRPSALLVIALCTVGLASSAGAAGWKVDQPHTTVGFSIDHLFTSVQGRFDRFEGTIAYDPAKPEATMVKGAVEVASIDTNNEKRDKHLRSADFFDVEKYPKIEFESTSMKDVDGKRGKLEGKLTIHGVTKPVVLDVVYRGQGADPWGNVRAGFQGKVTINRKDYGLNWNETLETGGLLVGEEVEIEINVEGLLTE